MSIDISQVAKKLTAQSIKGFYNPFTHIPFPERIERHSWFTSPELISIFGSSTWKKLTEAQQKNLSFFETINFFSLNIHGEKSLLEGLTQKLYESENPDITDYIHHFIDEENKHMYFFGTFCEKYAGKIYPDRKLVFPREYAPGEEEFLFFIKIFVFEEIVDYYNITAARDERVDSLSRQINLNHHEDEVRHLAFGRVLINDLFKTHSPQWSAETLTGIREYIRAYYMTTWREYYNPDIYADAGLENPYDLAIEIYESDKAKEHRNRASRTSLQYLKKCGVIEEIFEL
ncbi:MAG: diiron oxygenase [Pseudobdellovibrionaceae bacterium]